VSLHGEAQERGGVVGSWLLALVIVAVVLA
jgi:hypothetical protein